jgi:hypothetical protein
MYRVGHGICVAAIVHEKKRIKAKTRINFSAAEVAGRKEVAEQTANGLYVKQFFPSIVRGCWFGYGHLFCVGKINAKKKKGGLNTTYFHTKHQRNARHVNILHAHTFHFVPPPSTIQQMPCKGRPTIQETRQKFFESAGCLFLADLAKDPFSFQVNSLSAAEDRDQEAQ